MYKYCIFLIVYKLAVGAAKIGPDGCVLPAYPPHGAYTVHNRPDAAPGQTHDTAVLTVICNPGYGVVGSNVTNCSGGDWQTPMPRCIRFCKLLPDPSVNYLCKITGDSAQNSTRMCQEWEPDGTVVVPECNRPVYYSSGVLLNMRCVQGNWDHIAACQPDCGTSTPIGEKLIINGAPTERGELPWHAGIYDKWFSPFKQICGGSLISNKVIISAAHCFWKFGEGQQPASSYAVALGKIYRPWNNAMDSGVHMSNVSQIKIPVRYMGDDGHNQDDIALVVMATPVVYVTYIRPVCIDFDVEFDRSQLQNTSLGRVAGWGLTSENGVVSKVLLTTELQYVDVEKCIAEVPISFRAFVTNDKICAGGNGTTVCKGDSGGGLVFPYEDRGTRRYFLRGVVSSAPSSGQKCNANSYTTFTHILSHAKFITDRRNLSHEPKARAINMRPEAFFVTARGVYRINADFVRRGRRVVKDYGLGNVSVNNGQVHIGSCVLPEYPPHGNYTVFNKPGAAPGQAYDTAILTVSCDARYGVVGKSMTYCFGKNNWPEPMPQCHPLFCEVIPHPSVKYHCKGPQDQQNDTRSCNEYEPNDTVIVSRCNRPKYQQQSQGLPDMHCVNGSWDRVTICEPGDDWCVLPSFIQHGTYEVVQKTGHIPGHGKMLILQVNCDSGYEVMGISNAVFCVNGVWEQPVPQCYQSSFIHAAPPDFSIVSQWEEMSKQLPKTSWVRP